MFTSLLVTKYYSEYFQFYEHEVVNNEVFTVFLSCIFSVRFLLAFNGKKEYLFQQRKSSNEQVLRTEKKLMSNERRNKRFITS